MHKNNLKIITIYLLALVQGLKTYYRKIINILLKMSLFTINYKIIEGAPI